MIQHNTDILAKLVLDDGSILRAEGNALPTLDCLMRDPQIAGGGLLQTWAVNPLPGKMTLRFSLSDYVGARRQEYRFPLVMIVHDRHLSYHGPNMSAAVSMYGREQTQGMQSMRFEYLRVQSTLSYGV